MRDTTKAIERIRIEICKLWEAIADINKHQSQVEPHAEPKPEPAKEQFEVGDWVKYDIDSYLQVIAPSGKERTLCRTLSGIMVYPYTSCLTKASHSEVVVPITISGTVRPAYNEDGTIDDEQFQLLPNGSWDGTEMFISFDALDSHTRKLVESLLKAQEEK
jgi:hypothetical protein